MGNPHVRIYRELLYMNFNRKLLFQIPDDGCDGFPLSANDVAGFLVFGSPHMGYQDRFSPTCGDGIKGANGGIDTVRVFDLTVFNHIMIHP